MSTGISTLRRPARAGARPAPDTAALGVTGNTTVSRHLAHKQTPEQVFITGVTRAGGSLVALGGLPALTRFFNDSVTPGSDALAMAEFIRQGVEVIAHALLGVPLTSHFVLRSVELELACPRPAAIGDPAAPAVITLLDRQVRRGGSGLAYAARGPVYCRVGGRLAARLDGTFAFLSREAYGELRSAAGARPGLPGGAAVPAGPAIVGRQFRENVLITEPAGPPRQARCLVVPQPHPAFFDRPLDHYPGMMIAEAARQLAVSSLAAVAGLPAGSVRTDGAAQDFVSFAELDPLVSLAVTRWTDTSDGAELTVTARQGARVTSTSRFRLVHGSDGGRAS
jgi:hypothetical protein